MSKLVQPSPVRRTVTPNGLRVLTESVPQFASATLGIWVENGSRYETPERNGISHFLEHIFFKGTQRRSAKQIAEEIEAVGGVLNAFTDKEYTCYYAKVLGDDLPLAFDVLADLFTNSVFAEEEIERERTVILSEIAEVEDAPDHHIHVLFDEHFWPGHPLARPIVGTAETVGGMRRSDFVRFVDERYRPDRVLVCAAGAVDHDWLVEQVGAKFESLAGTSQPPELTPPVPSFSLSVFEKDLEQVQMLLGVPGLPQGDERRYAAYVLNTALGAGMSSRLFQEVRERRGKAYSISSSLASFRDSGYLSIYAALGAPSVREVVEVVQRELRALHRSGLEPDELQRAKTQIKGTMLLSLENTASRMTRMATNEMYYGRQIGPEEVAAAISAVTHDDVLAVANDLMATERMAVALLGHLDGAKIDDSILSLA